MKTSELTGVALGWAVAKCLYGESVTKNGKPYFKLDTYGYILHHTHENGWRDSQMSLFRPFIDWSQAGPIIEREKISVISCGSIWFADMKDDRDCDENGATPLEAAMRCYVASKLGDEVDLPEELR